MSDGIVLAAACASAAGLAYCMNNKRSGTAYRGADDSVCASARRATPAETDAVSARYASTTDAYPGVWESNLSSDEWNLNTPSKAASGGQTYMLQTSTRLQNLELSNGNKGIGNDNINMKLRGLCTPSTTKPKRSGHRQQTFIGQRDDPDTDDEM